MKKDVRKIGFNPWTFGDLGSCSKRIQQMIIDILYHDDMQWYPDL